MSRLMQQEFDENFKDNLKRSLSKERERNIQKAEDYYKKFYPRQNGIVNGKDPKSI